jgi:hypothetical protein
MKEALDEAARVCERHHLVALDGFLNSCRIFAREERLNVAIFGRSRPARAASSTIFWWRPLLPVGAIPVTSVVTEI